LLLTWPYRSGKTSNFYFTGGEAMIWLQWRRSVQVW